MDGLRDSLMEFVDYGDDGGLAGWMALIAVVENDGAEIKMPAAIPIPSRDERVRVVDEYAAWKRKQLAGAI